MQLLVLMPAVPRFHAMLILFQLLLLHPRVFIGPASTLWIYLQDAPISSLELIARARRTKLYFLLPQRIVQVEPGL